MTPSASQRQQRRLLLWAAAALVLVAVGMQLSPFAEAVNASNFEEVSVSRGSVRGDALTAVDRLEIFNFRSDLLTTAAVCIVAIVVVLSARPRTAGERRAATAILLSTETVVLLVGAPAVQAVRMPRRQQFFGGPWEYVQNAGEPIAALAALALALVLAIAAIRSLAPVRRPVPVPAEVPLLDAYFAEKGFFER